MALVSPTLQITVLRKRLNNDHERVPNDPAQAASLIKALLDEFLTELGRHRMRPSG